MKAYILLGIVFVVSLVVAWNLPTTEVMKGITAIPAIGALLGAVFQTIRDDIAHSRAERLRQESDIFNLSIASHMANVAFDKQVMFCEKYMAEVHRALETLFQEGTTKKVADHAISLAIIHRDYAAWIPKSVALNLQPFEKAILDIASKDNLIEAWRGAKERSEERSRLIDQMFNTFPDVMGFVRDVSEG